MGVGVGLGVYVKSSWATLLCHIKCVCRWVCVLVEVGMGVGVYVCEV